MAELSVQIDSYINGVLGHRYDMALYDEILTAAQAAGLPPISISASQGQLLHILVRLTGARRILEIGSLGGYSGTWLASALPDDGKLVTLELDPKHAAAAKSNFKRAGVYDKVTVIEGPASESLHRLIADDVEPFDMAFIDADKPGYVGYLHQALQLVRKGGVILGDNTLSHGVLEGDQDGGIAKFNKAVAQHPRLMSAIIPVMKDKVDGFSISIVN